MSISGKVYLAYFNHENYNNTIKLPEHINVIDEGAFNCLSSDKMFVIIDHTCTIGEDAIISCNIEFVETRQGIVTSENFFYDADTIINLNPNEYTYDKTNNKVFINDGITLSDGVYYFMDENRIIMTYLFQNYAYNINDITDYNFNFE